MSTALYILGFVVLIAGLAWAASALGVPSLWVTIGVVVVAGIAIISLAGNLRETEATRPRPDRQPPPPERQPPPPERQPPPPDRQTPL